MTITSWTLISTLTGSIVIDAWKSTYSSFPPTVSNSITGTDLPTLSSQIKNQNTGVTAWSPTVTAGDIIMFNVNSASTVTNVTLAIKGNLT